MEERKEIKMIISSDLHFLSKKLYDGGHAFRVMTHNGDGKQVEKGEKLIDQMLLEVGVQRPDVLLITGDLTFNGEWESHLEMAQKLREIQSLGIPVYLLPGNHDIGHPNAKRYVGDEVFPVKSITKEEFVSIYWDMGYKQAIVRDQESLSYVVEMDKKVWLFCLDNCARKDGHPLRFGKLSEETLGWLERWLQKAVREGVCPIVAGHYNLALHNQVFRHGFSMQNREQVCEVLERYGVRLFLSGHMHMQHRQKMGNVMDIATSCPCTYPHQYGVLRLWKDGYRYQTQRLMMSKEERADYERFYYNNGIRQAVQELRNCPEIPVDERMKMAYLAARMNEHYFAGTLYQIKDDILTSERWKLWQKYGGENFFYKYLSSMLLDSMEDHNYYEYGNQHR